MSSTCLEDILTSSEEDKDENDKRLQDDFIKTNIWWGVCPWLSSLLYQINPNSGGSYIDFHDWIKNKKTAIISLIKKIINAFNTQSFQ